MLIDSVAIAEQLNQSCHCIALDQAALENTLRGATGSAEAYARILKDQPALFSSSPVFLARQQIAAMQEVVEAIETVLASPAFQELVGSNAPEVAAFRPGASGVFQGYDFHLGERGPQLIEINTNAGGGLLNAVLARAQAACCQEVDAVLGASADAHTLPAVFLSMFEQEWRAVRGDAPLRSIAIVDEAPEKQFLYPEFELFQQLFSDAGYDAHIVDVAELSFRDSALFAGSSQIDLVYNRCTDFYFEAPSSHALRLAYEANAAVVTPNPSVYARSADKRHLVTLSNADRLRRLGVDASTVAILAAGIPSTIDVQSCDAEQLWSERKRYFFKPVSGFAGKAAYRGDKITRKVWQSILERPYVAQEIVAPSRRTLRIEGRDVPLKLDVRNYVYRGQIQLTAARLYEGQTTNFRTLGGGFAPVFSENINWQSPAPPAWRGSES